MRYLAVLTLFASSFACANNATLITSTAPWEPLEIKQEGEIVTIVLNERRITDTIYKAIINSGVCMPLWLDKNNEYLNGIKGINILNMHEKQGFTLGDPMVTCNKMGAVSENDSKIILMGNTSIH